MPAEPSFDSVVVVVVVVVVHHGHLSHRKRKIIVVSKKKIFSQEIVFTAGAVDRVQLFCLWMSTVGGGWSHFFLSSSSNLFFTFGRKWSDKFIRCINIYSELDILLQRGTFLSVIRTTSLHSRSLCFVLVPSLVWCVTRPQPSVALHCATVTLHC